MADNRTLLEINKIYKSDKSTKHRYIQDYYETTFGKIRHDVKTLMEIGVYHGASLMLWHDYFSQAKIYGVDVNPACVQRFRNKFSVDRVEIIIGNSVQKRTYQNLNETFDIIIDDGSHRGIQQIQTFDILFPKLNHNGIYIIEDISPLEVENISNHLKNLNLNFRLIDMSTELVPDSIIIEIMKKNSE